MEGEQVPKDSERQRNRRKSQRTWPTVSECLPDRVRVRSTGTTATGAGCCPSARATKAGKLTAPHHGQLCLLGARSECLGRHEPRARARWSHVRMETDAKR